VTGSTDGIGLETAQQVAARGVRVVVHGRSPERVARALATLSPARERPHAGVVADLSSLAAVREMARELRERDELPDVLVNNAGIYAKEFRLSPDGIELTMAVNHFAPWLLTRELLSFSESTVSRIVNVSSIAHSRGTLSLDDIACTRRPFDAYAMYAASKLANVHFTRELAERLGTRAAVNALHPGVVSTKLLKEGFGMQGSDSLADGAKTSVMLALDDAYAEITGGYYAAGKPARLSSAAQNGAFAQAFYEATEKLVDAALEASTAR
jgi:NAD(P)-dependent dehydrogenase (short-subunit alcohol dehydrogenase family)